jgi:hypothetical protein
MVQALTRLPRDSDRRPHGGDHRCPRHPDATVVRTRIWRCTVDGCGWVKQDRSLLGAHQDQDGPVKLTGTLRDQDGLGEVGDSEDQDGPGPPRCVKVGCIAPAVNGFICADHLVGAAEAADLIDPPPETAAEPTTRLVPWPTPPGWQPPPLAPSHHIAQGFQKRRPPDPNGGSAP